MANHGPVRRKVTLIRGVEGDANNPYRKYIADIDVVKGSPPTSKDTPVGEASNLQLSVCKIRSISGPIIAKTDPREFPETGQERMRAYFFGTDAAIRTDQ